jgi:hypothetical protein
MQGEKQLSRDRWAGVAGIAGALLFFCGDMLYYGHGGSGANFPDGMLAVVRSASLTRLFVGGLIGPLAACLCLIGFWRVRECIAPRSPVLGQLTFLSGAAMMVAGSAVHALWVPRGLAYRYAEQGYPPELLAALRDYWQAAYYVAAAPAYVCSFLLLVAVSPRQRNASVVIIDRILVFIGSESRKTPGSVSRLKSRMPKSPLPLDWCTRKQH